jgi:hypothetical protein
MVQTCPRAGRAGRRVTTSLTVRVLVSFVEKLIQHYKTHHSNKMSMKAVSHSLFETYLGRISCQPSLQRS